MFLSPPSKHHVEPATGVGWGGEGPLMRKKTKKSQLDIIGVSDRKASYSYN